MAAPRPPQFNFPAVERTLPGSYPTPLVGDVVFVVQKNTTEPVYAVPVYGTRHPDTLNFPNHQLAFVHVSDDRQTAQWFYVANRQNQDLYNYAIKYIGDSAAHKTYIRSYIVPRDGYERPAVGTPDSVDPTAFLVAEENQGPANDQPEFAGLFNKIVRVFETIPGPVLGGEDRMTTHRALLPFIAAVKKTVTTQSVLPGTPADSGFNDIESKVTGDSVAKAIKTTTTVDHFATLTDTQRASEAHGALATTTRTIVTSGTPAPAGGLSVLQAGVEDVDGVRAIKTVTQLAESWPQLIEYAVDEQTTITVKIVKTVVDVSEATDAAAGKQGSWYVEFKALDKFKCVKIQSQVVGSMPSDIVYYSSRPLSLPDTLLSITPLWDNSNNGGSGAGNGAESSAHASASSYTDGDILVQMQHGFRGYAKARITKKFLSAPPDQSAIPTPTIIKPAYGTAVIIAKGQSSSAQATSNGNSSSSSFSGGSQIKTKARQIGPVLTTAVNTTTTHTGQHQHNEASSGTEGPAYIVESADADSTATLQISIPASTPSAINSGTYILDEVTVEQWRLGVWVLLIVEVLVP
jgi:hypothetical protein